MTYYLGIFINYTIRIRIFLQAINRRIPIFYRTMDSQRKKNPYHALLSQFHASLHAGGPRKSIVLGIGFSSFGNHAIGFTVYRFTSERYRERGNTQDKRRRTGKRRDIADAHGQQTRITCTVCTHAGIDAGLYT